MDLGFSDFLEFKNLQVTAPINPSTSILNYGVI